RVARRADRARRRHPVRGAVLRVDGARDRRRAARRGVQARRRVRRAGRPRAQDRRDRHGAGRRRRVGRGARRRGPVHHPAERGRRGVPRHAAGHLRLTPGSARGRTTPARRAPGTAPSVVPPPLRLLRSAMTFADRVDPAYRDVVAALTGVVPARGGTGDVDERRAALALIGGSVAPPPGAYDVEHEDRVVPGPEDAPALRVRVYRPARPAGDLPVILHVHGGGMWLGDLESEHDLCRRLSEAVGAVVVSGDYRLAPESPYPAAADDCYAALQWVAGSARELGVDAARLAVFGGSAGGGLAIATALRARDLGGPAIRLLMAVYPMVDDRHETPS